MVNTLSETQAISKLADHLYSFLPGSPHPFANAQLSFPGVANSLGLTMYWPGGSKGPAIAALLEGTFANARGKFCGLILGIVKEGMKYRRMKKEPVTREDIDKLNGYVQELGFKIPELWDQKFLQSLSSTKINEKIESGPAQKNLALLFDQLIELGKLTPQQRGYAFEKFLAVLFRTFNMNPRSPFKLVGEQIDGSVDMDGSTYLVEAKWQNSPIQNADLLVFHGKIESKASWARGIFISYSGFTQEGLEAFSRGRSTNLIALDGLDLSCVLEGKVNLIELLRFKARRAAEEGRIMVSAREMC